MAPLQRSLLPLLLASIFAGCSSKAAESDEIRPVTVWWFQWPPAAGLAELAQDFTRETGIAVDVRQIPLDSYQEQVFQEFGGNETKFDIVIGDSQWIGRGATKGLYEELTEWLPSVIALDSIHPRAARYLCEYPEGSGRWYAAPCETDAIGLAYRKDWFEDAAERTAFKKRFGRELAVPATWEEFRDIAQFFQRPAEKRYGCAFPTGRAYDSLTMGFQNLLWAFGGKWHADDSNHVVGHLNTPATAAALEFFAELVRLGPKGAENLGYGEVLEAFQNGSTAMLCNYFAFFPSIQAQYGERVGFAPVPGKDGRRVASLGGQGLSISTRIAPERKELAKKFIAWFLQRPVQERWIEKPAGFTANTAILASPAFRAQTPYNAPFADSIDTMRDFWNVPVFNELLNVTQKHLGKAIDGELSVQDALDQLAAEKERILKEAGLLP
ncbi:MAG: sugar ABC transporter substrate-binding protein [Planctomycetes bacterium]|nr:sugar ABC transporter substrate-binding protein [Planctomycetota bacterium]